jgi:hypothetical protein
VENATTVPRFATTPPPVATTAQQIAAPRKEVEGKANMLSAPMNWLDVSAIQPAQEVDGMLAVIVRRNIGPNADPSPSFVVGAPKGTMCANAHDEHACLDQLDIVTHTLHTETINVNETKLKSESVFIVVNQKDSLRVVVLNAQFFGSIDNPVETAWLARAETSLQERQ